MDGPNLEFRASVPETNAPVRMVHLVYQDDEDEHVALDQDAPASSGCPPKSLQRGAVPSINSESSLAIGQKCLDEFLAGK